MILIVSVGVAHRFSFAELPYREGLAQDFIIGKDFIGLDYGYLILWDNISVMVFRELSVVLYSPKREV